MHFTINIVVENVFNVILTLTPLGAVTFFWRKKTRTKGG